MTTVKEYSPFYKIRRTLILLRWTFGFPFQAKDDSYTEFRFVVWLECLRLLVLCLLSTSFFVFWLFALLIVDGSLENLIVVIKSYCNSYATSKTIDFWLIFVWPLSAVMTPVVYVLFFKHNAKSISNFCKEATMIKSKINAAFIIKREEVKQARCITVEKSEKLIIYGQTFNAISSFLFGMWKYNTCKVLTEDNIHCHYGSISPILLPFMQAFQIFFICFGPMSCSVELVICQLINSLSGLFKDWTDTLQSNPAPDYCASLQPVNNIHSLDNLETGEM